MWDLLCQSRAQIEARIARGARDRFPMLTRSKPIARSRLQRKPPKKRKGADPAYLAFLREQPCAVCSQPMKWWLKQESKTQAAHVGTRGLGQRAPDKTAIPLCRFHHLASKAAAHTLGKRFWERHALDKETLITYYQAAYQAQGGVLE